MFEWLKIWKSGRQLAMLLVAGSLLGVVAPGAAGSDLEIASIRLGNHEDYTRSSWI